MPPAALPQPPHPVALRTGDAGLLANEAPPHLQSIQARLTLNPPSNPPPQQEPHWFFPNPHHHVPQVCICIFSLLALMHTSCVLTGSSLISFSRSKSSVFSQLFPGVSLPNPGLQDSNAGYVTYCLWYGIICFSRNVCYNI